MFLAFLQHAENMLTKECRINEGSRASRNADSEIRMDDGALHDDFSEHNRSWDDSETIISDI